MYAISRNLFQIFSQVPTACNHLTLTPIHSLYLSKPPKTVCILPSITKHYHLLSFPEHYQQHLLTMKFKSDISTSETKITSDQQNTDSSIPKMIEPLTTIPPTKPKKKNAPKSAAKKKKSSKKGESKVALDMTDLYVKENPFKSTKVETSMQDAKNTKDDETLKISADVSTPDLEKGNPDETLISNVPESGRKLGLEDLNDAIDSTENMDIDTGNETKVNDSVGKDPDETDVQEDVGPDVETSLGQPSNTGGVTTTDGGDKDSSFETAPEKNVNSNNSIENSFSEEGKESEEISKETEEEECSKDKEKDKDVVDVDELDLDNIPLVNTLGDSVAKRLRSNKGKVVFFASKIPRKKTTSVTKTPKIRTKSIGIGPKKGWSKVNVKTDAGSSRKRKVISSSESESEYEAEEDVLNIISSNVKKSAGKKNVQIVENVPIAKVSFHLPEFAQRWKFIYHRRQAVERELSKEAVKIKGVMELIKEAGLMKTVCNLGDCYEMLVKEFWVNIHGDCDNPLSREYQKVYVRGECVNFSPNIINIFLRIDEEGVAELEATDNQVSRIWEINFFPLLICVTGTTD